MSRVSLCAAGLSLALWAPSGCGGGGGGTVTQVQTAAAPVISPGAGTYTSTQSVTITDSTPSSTIYYTTNGTAPSTASTQYSGAFQVSATETVEAMATAPNYSASSVTSATFTINEPPPIVATPSIATANAQNGAEIVTLADTTSGATIYYTTDGSTPTSSSTQYLAPFLVDTNITVNAIATASGDTNSSVATQTFSGNIPSGTLVWEDSFSNSGTANAQPNPATWTYDTGYQCCGNNEQETYCAWGSNTAPCNSSTPNAFLAPNNGGLNIVAMNPSGTYYTSARLKTEGLFSFQYGRIEATMSLPESQAMWPAFWMLGNNITTISWPACGETDIMEHIDGNNTPFGGPGNGAAPGYDWIAGSLHGGSSSSSEVNATGDYPSPANGPTSGFSAAGVHTYGIIWTQGQVQFYVDSPSNIYETDTSSTFGPAWPFDQGPMFIILNLAVGGDWPGDVNSSTVFPSTMTVQNVKIYTN
jgi:beta-glucanase (GH16 family)